MIISAGVVPVRKTEEGYKYLLLRAWGRFYDFPKGRVEENEDIFQTALRETLEEASISKEELDFKWGKDYYTTEPFNTKRGKKRTKYFVAETTREEIILPVNPELGHPEHDAYTWVTYEEGQELTNYRIGKVLEWARNKVEGEE